jgi:hypothetical protein
VKLLLDSDALISASELVDIVGADPESVSNWIRRGIITRSPLGGRTTRNRLFSTKEVYKTVLRYELIKTGLSPSSANDAVGELWKGWFPPELPEGKNVYAILAPTGDKWSASLCWQKKSGGALNKSTKQSGFTGSAQMELPNRAFVVLPLSDVLAEVTTRLMRLLEAQST